MFNPLDQGRKRNYRLVILSILLLISVVITFNVVMAQAATITGWGWDGYNLRVDFSVPVADTYRYEICYPGCNTIDEGRTSGGNYQVFNGFEPLAASTRYYITIIRLGTGERSNTVWCLTNASGTNCAGDRDNDGVIDPEDACPDQGDMGWGLNPNGCPIIPDRDIDGVPDHLDRCPDDYGPIELDGCPDKDGDGVPDIDDHCPNKKGPKSNNGCPLPPVPGDRDGDGVPDHLDDCADKFGDLPNGCPTVYSDPSPYLPEPEHLTITPTPDAVTRFDPTAPCNLAPRPNARGARIKVYGVIGGGDVIGLIEQSGQGSGPFKVLSVSADGQWYQIGRSLHSADFWGWVPAGEVQPGGLNCGELSNVGPLPLVVTPIPDESVVNAEKVEVLVNRSIDGLLSECTDRVPEYLEFLSNMVTVDRSEAEKIAERVETSSNICEGMIAVLDETLNGINRSSVVNCLKPATKSKVDVILMWADKLQLHDQQFTDVCEAVIKDLALLGDIEESKIAFSEKLRQTCGYSSLSTFNLLVMALKNNIDLTRVVEEPQFCGKAYELVTGEIYRRELVDIPPELQTCDLEIVTLFLGQVKTSSFLQENLDLFLKSSDPCKAVRRWILFSEVPRPSPITPPPGDNQGGGDVAAPIVTLPIQEVIPTKVVQITLPDSRVVSINSLDWMAADTDLSYLGVFVAPSEDGKSTDLYTFTRGNKVTALYPNSAESEKSPSISGNGVIAYTFDMPDGSNGIKYVKENKDNETIQIPEGWRLEAAHPRLVWDQDEKLYFTLINMQSQIPAIWRSDSGPVEMVIEGATNPFIVNVHVDEGVIEQLVVKVVNTSAEAYGYIETYDLPKKVDELSLYQPPAGLGQCSEMTVYQQTDVMMVCNGAIVIAPLQNGPEPRIFNTGRTSIFNLSLVPATESYITWDDGDRIYRCKLSAECTPIEFSVFNAAPVTSLDWR